MVDPFKMPQFEVPAEMRDLANKSVEQSSIKATKDAVGFAEQNVKAALDHAQSLVKAKGFDEVMKLQSEFMRLQMAAMQDQMKSMGGMMQETVKPSSAKPSARPKK
jgi:hypothetical protein